MHPFLGEVFATVARMDYGTGNADDPPLSEWSYLRDVSLSNGLEIPAEEGLAAFKRS